MPEVAPGNAHHPRRDTQFFSGQLLVASANLIRLLVLDPAAVFAPVEPPECIIHLIPDEIPLDDLVIQGLRNRPELASARELVEAAIVRVKQARLRPSLSVPAPSGEWMQHG